MPYDLRVLTRPLVLQDAVECVNYHVLDTRAIWKSRLEGECQLPCRTYDEHVQVLARSPYGGLDDYS